MMRMISGSRPDRSEFLWNPARHGQRNDTWVSILSRSWRVCAKCLCCQILQDVGHGETWHHLFRGTSFNDHQRPTQLALVHSMTRKCASSLWWAKISVQWDVAFLMPSARSTADIWLLVPIKSLMFDSIWDDDPYIMNADFWNRFTVLFPRILVVRILLHGLSRESHHADVKASFLLLCFWRA